MIWGGRRPKDVRSSVAVVLNRRALRQAGGRRPYQFSLRGSQQVDMWLTKMAKIEFLPVPQLAMQAAKRSHLFSTYGLMSKCTNKSGSAVKRAFMNSSGGLGLAAQQRWFVAQNDTVCSTVPS